MLSQRPPTKPRSANARAAAPGVCSSGGDERRDAAQKAGAPATQPTAPKLRRMLTASASAPNIGPRIAPKTAAPKAVPISSPRRDRGVSTVSQARAPAQVTVLDAPWTKRARPSVHGPSAAANPKLASARRRGRQRRRASGRSAPRRARPARRRAGRRPRTRRRAAPHRSSRGRTPPRTPARAARARRTASRRRRRRSRRARGVGILQNVPGGQWRTCGRRRRTRES